MPSRPIIFALGSALAVSACSSLTTNGSGTTAGDIAGYESTVASQADAGGPAEFGSRLTLSQPDDIWARIRGGFAIEFEDMPRIEAEVTYFANRPEYMERVADRAEPYLYHIVSEIEKRGLPMELALLPVVESAFQPFAYSPGRAAGIWQFIPSTGRHFGLKQTWWYDGRRDVLASTDAALTYLESLYQQFDDWKLALAAYNAGQGTVRSAIRRNRRAGKPTDYWHLPLPRETQSYVPRLLAIRSLVENPDQYGLVLRPLANEPYLDLVEVGSQIDLSVAAEMADLPVEEIYRLNPGFNRWATDPDGPHRLVLPRDRVEQFTLKLAELPEEKRVRWHRHQVRQGQTLSHIARDYKTTVAIIREANKLRGNTIRVGDYLIVPTARKDAEHYVLSATQRLAKVQSRERDGKRHVHTVRKGETLWELSRQYDVTVGQIARWNGMAPGDPLRPGQDLAIWLPEGKVQAAVPKSPVPRIQSVRYTVRSGDSLYKIARRFNVTVTQVRQWNNLPEQGYLQPGQRLLLKVDVTSQSGSRT